MKAERFVFCQYSEDIRQELNEQISLIGIYQGGVRIAGSAPATLPRLVVSIYITTDTNAPFDTLEIKLMMEDEEIQAINLPYELLERMKTSIAPDSKKMMVSTAIKLQPLGKIRSGKLRVLVKSGKDVYEGNPLKIEVIQVAANLPSE